VLRFLLGLAVIDAAVIAGFGLVGRAPAAAPAAAPVATADAGAARVAWKGIDPAALGKKLAAVYTGARRRVGKNKRVVLAAPRRTGDDVELRVSSAHTVGFPPGLYCFHCATQRCLYPEPTLAALEAVAGAFAGDDVRELARLAGEARVQLTFVGGASAGPVVPKSDGQLCDGPMPRVEARVPPAYDVYASEACGARACELAGSGEQIDVAAGPIDDNRKLACLRALCTGAAAPPPADLTVKYVGELAFEQGGAYRGAEAVVTLRGIGADHDAYLAFWASLTQALEEDGK
jgi:hypothetical protein